jgi:glycogen debranching enzyme
MKTLARIAKELGTEEQSEYWDRSATALLRKLLDHSWRDGRFIAPVTRTHEFDPHPTSLLPLMPIVLGSYLDMDRFDNLVGILESDFLTEHGPATETTTSRFYEDDGYCRGPIWAPHTYLLVDGLKRGGRHDIAKEIARRFCAMIEDRALGFYESFDAKTGSGYRALGYSWTASVYLLLAHEYLS